MFLMLPAIVFGSSLGGFRQPVQHGVYTGEIVDVQEQRGLIFKTNEIDTKTNERSSDPVSWCIEESRPELLEKAQRLTDSKAQVRIEYHDEFFVWIKNRCSPSTRGIVNSIEIVGKGGR